MIDVPRETVAVMRHPSAQVFIGKLRSVAVRFGLVLTLIYTVLTPAIAQNKASWDGEKPASMPDDADGNRRVLCGYVYEGKRFWQIHSVPALIRHYDRLRCPPGVTPSDEELERLKTALPYRADQKRK